MKKLRFYLILILKNSTPLSVIDCITILYIWLDFFTFFRLHSHQTQNVLHRKIRFFGKNQLVIHSWNVQIDYILIILYAFRDKSSCEIFRLKNMLQIVGSYGNFRIFSNIFIKQIIIFSWTTDKIEFCSFDFARN